MDAALDYLAAAADVYENANYGHALLGGRWDEEFADLHGDVSAGSYECDVMNRVWMHAKCMDLIDKEDHDGFFTLDQYANIDEDFRRLPSVCPKTFNYEDAVGMARNLEEELPNGETRRPWPVDDMQTYAYLFDRPDADACGNNANPRRSRVRTGLTISRTTGVLNYNEYICLVPGCYSITGRSGYWLGLVAFGQPMEPSALKTQLPRTWMEAFSPLEMS